ncbi:sugar ABC transporter substrate-binding protein [Micromonospora sp. Llam0]|uniref:sugar ABC transporter substrate-binding protein n=1 Tax=Micromonospora sp. Llam0 TaxID=2485143 RepID=UPI0018F5A801|nr:sugar ABC transporter substrate-binding protein [Micromonospora sp. Llam0]
MIALGAVAVLAVTAACGDADDPESPGGTSGLKIGYSSPVASQPSQALLTDGLNLAAKELGWTVSVVDANLSPDAQVSNVQTMIQQNVAGIGLWALDAGAMEGAYARAKDANIPVIGVNSTGQNVTSTVWWGFNLCDSEDAPFKQAAKQIATARPGGKVIVMGGPPVPSIQQNVKCFSDAATAAGLTIVNQTDNTKDTSAEAAALTADLFTKYKDVDAVWAYNDATALGASTSAQQAGLMISDGTSEGVIIQGANGDSDAIEAIKQGRLTGTWDPDAYATGMCVLKAIDDAKKGTSSKNYVVTAKYWDKSNIADYKEPAERGYTLANIPVSVK